MVKNYVIIALRHVRRQKGYALVNVLGLAVGMACCLVLLLYVQKEWSYDRFHEKAERIYRLTTTTDPAQRPDGQRITWPAAPPPVAPLLMDVFPEVERATRVQKSSHVVGRSATTSIFEPNVIYADPSFFEVFDFQLLEGSTTTALNRPNTLLLTASAAARHFGDSSPLGQTLRIDGQYDYTVVGLLADPPSTNHLTFDFVASYASAQNAAATGGWHDLVYTYVLLRPGTTAAALEQQFAAFIDTYDESQTTAAYNLLPLTDIWLHSDHTSAIDASPQGNRRVVYLSAAIALLVLLIACINYMNLATARSLRRGREVGLRKVVGARRGQLMVQFFSESLLFALLAGILALALTEYALPHVNGLMSWDVRLSYADWSVWTLTGGVILAVGLVSGSYPALFLSSFRPVAAFRHTTASRSNRHLRTGLVVFQFAATVLLVIATLVIQRQLDFALTKPLGFASNNLLVLPNTAPLGSQAEAFRQDLLASPTIAHAALTESLPFHWIPTATYAASQLEAYAATDQVTFQVFRAGAGFVETLGLSLLEGRSFETSSGLQTTPGILINQAAARLLGWTEPLGKTITDPTTNCTHHVIGVVADFHSQSMRHAIQPTLFFQAPAANRHLLIQPQGASPLQADSILEASWKRFVPDQPMQAYPYTAALTFEYQAEAYLRRLFSIFTSLALFIAMLGLLGLAAFTAEQRTKEIGIRKVLGATASGIVLLLSKDVAQRIAVAVLVALPLAYWGIDAWFSTFAYRAPVGLGTFALASSSVFLFAIGIASYQALRAALTDPVISLRHE